MAGRASGAERGSLETLALAGIGALALAAGRADDLAEDIADRLGLEVDDLRRVLADGLDSWLREAKRLGEHTEGSVSRLAQEVGVASREALEDLELRVAQVEHRLKLLERS